MKQSKGLSLLEVLISTAIIAVLAAAMIPALNSYNSNKKVATAAVLLDSIARAYNAFDVAVGKSPGNVRHLVEPIINNDSSSCNTTNGGALSTYGKGSGNWSGPYFNRTFNPVAGLDIGIGVVRDRIQRNSANNASGLTYIFIDNITLADVYALNQALDGNNETSPSSTGFVRWTQSNATTVSSAYVVEGVIDAC